MRLIGADGEQLGIVSLVVAITLAGEAEIDLVEIAPTAQPPVCRLMDYGKFRYQESKKRHETKLRQKQVQIKEVKFRPNTDDGDYKIKLRSLMTFLEDGDKAKITLRFRGREMAHQEFGMRLLERIRDDLEPYAIVEQFPRMEGRQMVMVLSAKKKELKTIKVKRDKLEEIKSNVAQNISGAKLDIKNSGTDFGIIARVESEKPSNQILESN